MSNVQAGGATVFPHLGVTLWPRKNSAAFWYNLYKSGDGDLLTRHAACPVLVGSKWVSNKWIHEIGQEFRKPCGLWQNELNIVQHVDQMIHSFINNNNEKQWNGIDNPYGE